MWLLISSKNAARFALSVLIIFLMNSAWALSPIDYPFYACPYDNTRVMGYEDISQRCPDGFIFYKEHYTEQELSRFRDFIASPQYKNDLETLGEDRNSFLAAKLMEFNHEPPRAIAYMFLASVSNRSADDVNVPYLQAAHAAFLAIPKQAYIQESTHLVTTNKPVFLGLYTKRATEMSYQTWLDDQIVISNIERRLQQFEQAKQRLEAVLSESLSFEQKKQANYTLGLSKVLNATEYRCQPDDFSNDYRAGLLGEKLIQSRQERYSYYYSQPCYGYNPQSFSILTALLLVFLAVFFAPHRGLFSSDKNMLVNGAMLAILVITIKSVDSLTLVFLNIVTTLVVVCWYQHKPTVPIVFYQIIVAAIFTVLALIAIYMLRSSSDDGQSIVLTCCISAFITLFLVRMDSKIHTLITAILVALIMIFLPEFMLLPWRAGSQFNSPASVALLALIGFSGLAFQIYVTRLRKINSRYIEHLVFWLAVVVPILLLHPIASFSEVLINTHSYLNIAGLVMAYLVLTLIYLWLNIRIFILAVCVYLSNVLVMLTFTYQFISDPIYWAGIFIMIASILLAYFWGPARTELLLLLSTLKSKQLA